MNLTPLNIERIVQEVVQRLSAVDGPVTPTPQAATTRSADAIINDRVVSVESLKDKLDGSQRIVISADAIVTPAAKDELRQRGLTLQRGSSAAEVTPHGDKLFVAYCGSTRVASIGQLAIQAGFRLQELGQAPADALANQLSRRLHAGDRAVLVCEQPCTTLCYANRHWQIRAIWGIDVATVQSARQTLDPNVMVIEPSRAGQSLDAIVAEFLRRGVV